VCSGQWCKTTKKDTKDVEMLRIPDKNGVSQNLVTDEIPKIQTPLNEVDALTQFNISKAEQSSMPTPRLTPAPASTPMPTSRLTPVPTLGPTPKPIPGPLPNIASQQTKLKFLPEVNLDETKSFTIPRPNIIGDKKDLGHLIEKNLIPRSEMRSPKVNGDKKKKETWPNLDQMMDLYRDTLSPLMQTIDNKNMDPLFKRGKVNELLHTFFVKCQTYRSSEKVGELDSRTAIILNHPNELSQFSFELGNLMSKTTEKHDLRSHTIEKHEFDLSNSEAELKMLESFFKICDEKESSEKLDQLCKSILKRLNLEPDSKPSSRDHSRSPSGRKQKNRKHKHSSDSTQRLLEEN